MFVTTANFVLQPYDIANVDKVADALNEYIPVREREVLLPVLGKTTYDALIAGQAAFPDVWDGAEPYAIDEQVFYSNKIWKSLQNDNTGNAPAEGVFWEVVANIWIDLIYGADYEINGTLYSYSGLAEIFTPYVWYRWTKDNFISNSGLGTVVPNAENAKVVSPAFQLCRAFNDFSEKIGHGVRNDINSLYGFLYANQETYPGTTYIEYGNLNEFGL